MRKDKLSKDDMVSINVNFDQAIALLAKKADKSIKEQQRVSKGKSRDKKSKGS